MKWIRNSQMIKQPILEYLEEIFDEELAKNYILKVSIGTDSQKAGGKGNYKFATVIVIETSEDLGGGTIVGRGAMVISATYFNQFKSLRTDRELVNERMVYEVGKSVEIAYELAPLLDLYGIPMEIHADINPDPTHDSNKALQHAIGYILGMGYSFKIKPDAFAASNGADKFC